ncbi:MAG TPA: hypothetical protein VHR84_13565 [Terriglobales bacterium]|nr:hypothetical protein [Terriglobales bacterium]
MTKRGKVLRDANAGPGLLMVEGQQYPFTLEGVWRSEVPPKPGLVIEAEFDQAGQVTGITAVPESQLAKEQAEAAMAVAKEKGAALASGMVAKFGLPNLVAAGILILGWFFFATVSLDAAIFGKLEFTFWQILGFLNSSNLMESLGRAGRSGPSAGMYGFFAILCLVGPFVAYFWKDKRAHLGGLLPLVFMVIVALIVRSSVHSALGGDVAGPYREMQERAQDEAMKALSLGMGAYLSILASLYFAGIGAKKFLASRASGV